LGGLGDLSIGQLNESLTRFSLTVAAYSSLLQQALSPDEVQSPDIVMVTGTQTVTDSAARDEVANGSYSGKQSFRNWVWRKGNDGES
jgi:hypothetical protein